jgi:hypothetical protein
MLRLSKSIRVELLPSDVSETRKRRRGVTAEEALLQPAPLLRYATPCDGTDDYATGRSGPFSVTTVWGDR